jgi:glucose/arabinose dehydrogenase
MCGPAAVLVAAVAFPAPAAAVRVTTVATGLEIPWEIAVLPGGDAIVPGGNYGWPLAYGPDQRPFLAPLRLYREPLAPSGATFVTRGPWRGDFIFACLRGAQLRRLTLRGDSVVADRPLLVARYGRLRTVVEAPGGGLFVLTSNRDGRGAPRRGDDRILRVEP